MREKQEEGRLEKRGGGKRGAIPRWQKESTFSGGRESRVGGFLFKRRISKRCGSLNNLEPAKEKILKGTEVGWYAL